MSLEIEPYACEYAWGNPSGHSTGSMGKLMIVYVDYLFSDKKSAVLNHICMKLLFLAIVLSFAFTVGYSRLFLGVHTVN